MGVFRRDMFTSVFKLLQKRRQEPTTDCEKPAQSSLDMTLSPHRAPLSQPARLGLPKLKQDYIRILELEPGSPDAPLVGTFQPAHVDGAGEYEPISYVWAQAPSTMTKDHAITVHQDSFEQAIQLTINLHSALKQLRYEDRNRRLWVDQICIDQGSDERSEQVKLMNKIYQNAQHVLAWLGVDNLELAAPAFELISSLDEALREMEGTALSAAQNEQLEFLIEKDRGALDALTGLPWFKRGWIVQEIGTMAPATMLWGDHQIDWEILHRVCENLNAFHHLRSRLKVRTSDIKYMYRRFVEPDPKSYHANRFNFIYELHRARSLVFSDPKDRIFAWLGHFSAQSTNESLAHLEANYNRTVTEVYIDVAVRALSGTKKDETESALIALAAVQHIDLHGSHESNGSLLGVGAPSDAKKLPSWVPDWRTMQSFILSEPISAHRAHAETTARLEIIADRSILRIHGVYLDDLALCSDPFGPKAFLPSPASRVSRLAISYIWSDVCGQTQFNLNEAYPSGGNRMFAMMQTLSNGCMQIAGRERISYHDIPNSRWIEQHALYLETYLKDDDLVADEIHEIAQRAATNNVTEEWSRVANGASNNRLFAITKEGYYVLAPKVAEPGDQICVLFGGKSPFCLRPQGETYLLVGECYVHGFMNGEAIDMLAQSALHERYFEIT